MKLKPWIVLGLMMATMAAISIVIYSRQPEKASETPLEGRTMNSESREREKKGQQSDSSALANRLMTIGYIELFQGPDEDVLDALWKEPGVPESLATLTINPEAPALARFLAAEIMFYKQETYPPDEQKKQLASVYATALAQNFTGVANTWGLPDVLDGFAGEHFVALGEAAIAELASLLEDDRRVYYVGSQEATLGNSYRYRVKDLAAFYIGKIRNTPLELDEDPSKRDEEIEKMKSAVE